MTSEFATRGILDLGGLWDFRFEDRQRGSMAKAIRSAFPAFGRPNFRSCATRREPGFTAAK